MAEEVEMTPVTNIESPKAKPLVKPTMGIKPGIKLPPKPSTAPGLAVPPKPSAALSAAPALKPAGIRPPLKPVIRKPGEAVAAAPLPKPMEALKSITQKLKSVTQEIPQQAVLHKTGIIAESAADGDKEAAKHKTSRIALSDAMGVAPVKDEAAPMKTIRIKRPDAILNAPSAAPTGAAPAAAEDSTVTQRKTLKIARPSGVAARPSGKFSIKRPGQVAATDAAAPAADGAVADIPEMPAVSAAPVPHATSTEESSTATTLSAIVQFAACAAIGALVWFLYQNALLPSFCGGLGWGA